MPTSVSRRGAWAATALAVTAAAALGGGALLAPSLTTGTVHPDPVTVITTTPPPPVIALPPAEIAARVVPTIVTITATGGFTTTAGTGIVLSGDGVILTNHHVISGARQITAVNLSNGLVYDVDVLGYDDGRDLAVLRLAGATDLPTASIGKSATVVRGDTVTAIGNAEGGGVPVSAPGKVTGLGVSVTARSAGDSSRNELKGLIEIDADVRPGDSGGPLVNAVGEVIGVSSAGNAVTDRTETSPAPQSYAIPIDTAMPLVAQILRGESSDTVRVGPTPVLGVAVRNSATGTAGAEVVAVSFDSPAEHAGLSKGSVLVEFGARPITSSKDLSVAMSSRHPGDAVDLKWIDPQGRPGSGSLILELGPPR